MVPLTAFMALVASYCLWSQQQKVSQKTSTLAAVVLVIAASMILLAHGVSRFSSPPNLLALGSGGWGLSSPITATMFIGIGLSLRGLATNKNVARAQWLAIGVLSLAALTLASYMFHDTDLYHSLPGTGTSILTVLILIMLSVGCLGARPAEGIMAAVTAQTSAAAIARRLLTSAIFLPILLGALIFLIVRFKLIDTDTAIAVLVWGIAVLSVGVTWLGILSLNHADLARWQAEHTLRETLVALEKADAHKDHFLAVLAHELRNPLAPIQSAADLLRLPNGVGVEQQHRSGQIITRQVEHISHLVEDILDMSRVRQGLLVVERAPVDLRLVANEAVEQTMPVFLQRQHQLSKEFTGGNLIVLGDHQRLVQVVTNLLANAAKYTLDGGQIILAVSGDQAEARITVTDNGIGIEETHLNQVFDSFTQVRRTAGRSKSGLGIGLALVKHLVELHQGTVVVHSHGLGHGSTFVVTLPLQG
jgi:signal transduction histidine kinase